MIKKILFIDRDGTLVKEPADYQIDDFLKLEFYPKAFSVLRRIAQENNFELVMVTNQDGLGTPSHPEERFWPIQNFILKAFENEGVVFKKIHIDKTFPNENAPTRKPRTGMLQEYFDPTKYNLTDSFVIGDRITDVELAKNLGCKAIWLNQNPALGKTELNHPTNDLQQFVALETLDWDDIYHFLKIGTRTITHHRNTNETKIAIALNLDGNGQAKINTGIPFFDHMLEQIAKHGKIDLNIAAQGDLHIDEHHTIEDVGIALGESFLEALGDKKGIERYGFCLPMDDCLAQVALDFGGRSWIVWEAKFTREKIGEMPTEMFFHFFKSFSDASKCNLNIQAQGENEHHKIEAIFKCFAKAIKMAIKRDINNMSLPSTKGVL